MDYRSEDRGGVMVISPEGELDAESTPAFQDALDQLLNAGSRYFVFDLSQVSFLDSSGLALLVRLYKRVRIGEGDVWLAAVPPAILHILDLTRLSRVFEVKGTVDEAVAQIQHAE